MHEHSFIQAILSDIVNKEQVKGISVEVGELAGIEAEHLKEHLIEETGWDIEVTTHPGVVLCDCGYKGTPVIKQRLHDMVIYECPKCKQIPQILEGQHIKIVTVRYK